jgi:hypothetical protein
MKLSELKTLIKECLKEITDKNVMFHITKESNIPSIKEFGLKVNKPADMDDKSGIYLFPTKEYAEDALMNWLGDRFDEDEPLAMLTIDTSNLQLETSSVDWEYISKSDIPPKNILKIESV